MSEKQPPVARIVHATGTAGNKEYHECGVIWGGQFGLSLQPYREADVEKAHEKYPRRTFTEAVAAVEAKNGFLNFNTPQGMKLVLVPEDFELEDDDF